MLLPAAAHSWVEQLMRIDASGAMTGNPGYVRGAVSRLSPAFTDLDMQHLLPPNGRIPAPVLLASDPMCRRSQTTRNYSTELPPLTASAGDYLALRYQENGHVTLPENTPNKDSSGYVYIYGTSEPRGDDCLGDIHGQWNEFGSGGDRRGRLLAKRPFDDGRCYQINTGSISQNRQGMYKKTSLDPQGADLWCQSDVKLPSPLDGSSYTLYWVWDWPSSPTKEFSSGKPELYTSCMDVDLTPRSQAGTIVYSAQDLNFAGIREQLVGDEG